MKKLSLLFVFVLAFVMLFAFNVFAEDTNIAKDATVTIDGQFWPIDGANGTKDCRNYIIDGDATTGLPSSWNTTSLNYYLTFENERTISKVVILCNGSGVSGNNPGDVTDMNCSNDFTVTLKDASGKALYTKTFNAKDQTTLTYELPQVYSAKSVVVTSKYGGYATNQSFLREVEIYEHIAAEKVTASREITDEATLYTDGGGNAEATRDNNVNTAGSCGSAQWVNFHYLYSDPRTISKVVVVVNSTGDVLDANGNVVKTHTELSKLPNIYCRLYDKDGNKLDSWENKPTSDATPVTDENGTYAVYTFDLDGKVYDGVAKVEIATVHSNDKGLGIWEVEIYNQYYVCAEGQHNWKDATCLAPKTCVDCGTQEGELAAHTPAEDDGDCSTAVRCSLCKIVLVEAKKHVTNADGACTNEGCTRVGEINVADKATMVEPGPSTWGHVKPQYLYDKDYSTSTHAPKSTGFSYTFIYDDARLISKIVIVANGASNQPSASTSTANHAIYEVLVTLYDDKGAAVYTSEAYAFENENTVIEIVLPATYYAYSVKCTFASTEAWGNSLVREIEIYDTTVEKEEEVEEIPAPQEGCFERVDFKEYIEKTYYYTENNDYYYVVDEDGNYILDEKGNAIKYAGAPIGGNGGANPPGCELDGSSGSGYCMTWEQQYNSIQYNFKDKLLFAEITIGYKTSGNAADGYKLYIGDIVDGEEVWTLVVDFIVPEEAEWKEYLLNTFTLGEEGEGVEGTMFRFEWIPGVAVRNDPSLCEVKMLTFKNTCTWTENKVLDEGNCGYDRVAECTCSVCGVEKTVVTPASGEHDLSVVANATSATCVDFGLNAVKYCATCEKTFGGDRIEKYTSVHTYGTADCNKNTCLVCGYVDSKVSVSAHTYGWNIGTDENGNQKHGCSVCLTEAVRDADNNKTSSNLGFTIFYAETFDDFKNNLSNNAYDVIRLCTDFTYGGALTVENANIIIDFGGHTYTKTGNRFHLKKAAKIVNGTIKQMHGLNAMQVYSVGSIEDFNIIVGAAETSGATGILMWAGSSLGTLRNVYIDSERDADGNLKPGIGLANNAIEAAKTDCVIGNLYEVKAYARGQALNLGGTITGEIKDCVFSGDNIGLYIQNIQKGIHLENCVVTSEKLAVYIVAAATPTEENPIYFTFDDATSISSKGSPYYIIPTDEAYDFSDLTSAVALVNGILYNSFDAALAALAASTAEVTTFNITGNITLTAPIVIDKAVQFSLGGGKLMIPVQGRLEFTETDAPGYTLTASVDGAFIVTEKGSLTVTGDKGTLVGGENAIVVNGGEVAITAGTYIGYDPSNYVAPGTCVSNKDGVYTLSSEHTYSHDVLNGVFNLPDGTCNVCGYVRGVARVNGAYYKTIEEAIAAAAGTEFNVDLAVNLDLEKSLVISSKVTIDLCRFTISASADTEGDGVFHVVAGGELTIYASGGGVVNGVCASEYDMAIWVEGGKVIIEAGTFTNVGAGDDDQYDLIYVKGGELEIKGGTFLAQTPKWTLNLHDKTPGSIVVNGGKFYAYNPSASESESPVANFVPANKCAVLDNDGYYVVTNHVKSNEWTYDAENDVMVKTCVNCPAVMETTAVIAKANGIGYASLEAAVAAGGEITLEANIDLATAVEINNIVTINLNGKKLTVSKDTEGNGVFYVVAGGVLTINGEGIVNGVGNNNYNIAIWANGGSVVINGGTFTNVGSGEDDHYDLIYAKNGGSVVINGGTFIAQTPKWTLNLHDSTEGTIVVNGGSFYAYNPSASESESPVANFVTEGKCLSLNNEGYYVVANHDVVVDKAVDATCTETGLTEGSHCSVCGTVFVAQESVDALGHTEGEEKIENNIPATSTTAGSYDKVVYCSVCNTELSRETVTVKPTCAHTNTEIIPAVPGELRNPGMTSGVKCADCDTIIVAPVQASGDFRIGAVSLSLGENINTIYKVYVPNGYTNVYMVFEVEGRAEPLVITKYEIGSDGRYWFTFNGIKLQSMADLVTATVYAENNGVVSANSYSNNSVKTYIINQLTTSNDAKLKTMLSDLLILGAKTQVYMNYKVNNLMTADVAEGLLTPSTYNDVPSSEFVQKMIINDEASRAMADWKAVSLTFKDAMTLQFKLLIDPAYANENLKIVVTIPGVTGGDRVDVYTIDKLTYSASENRYILEVDNVKALQYGSTARGDIYYNDVLISRSVEYSVNSYIQSNKDNSNTALRDFLRAVYQYGKSAYAYGVK